MVLFLNCCLHQIVISPTFGNMPCMVLSKFNIVKKFFFPDRTKWCIFHNIPDFSCNRCVKREFYSALVWKCTDMCKHGFGVQLLQNPPLCSSTLILYLDFQEVVKYKLSVIMPGGYRRSSSSCSTFQSLNICQRICSTFGLVHVREELAPGSTIYNSCHSLLSSEFVVLGMV